ncbi:MAG: hypothetical protein G01um1014106_261 [Parcubacteria group bacterium Gr01-1014_106]|nr:MAG: hypothetical protein G01um1014106_261 [Parcubacteria group bacterium Gr01-1014_106]
MRIVIGIVFVLLVLFASVIGGFFGGAILALSAAVGILLIALRSYLRPEAFSVAMRNFPQSVADPRSIFAHTARTAASGEVLVSYTRYRRVYRATVITLGILGALLLVAVVIALMRAGYPMQ